MKLTSGTIGNADAAVHHGKRHRAGGFLTRLPRVGKTISSMALAAIIAITGGIGTKKANAEAGSNASFRTADSLKIALSELKAKQNELLAMYLKLKVSAEDSIENAQELAVRMELVERMERHEYLNTLLEKLLKNEPDAQNGTKRSRYIRQIKKLYFENDQAGTDLKVQLYLEMKMLKWQIAQLELAENLRRIISWTRQANNSMAICSEILGRSVPTIGLQEMQVTLARPDVSDAKSKAVLEIAGKKITIQLYTENPCVMMLPKNTCGSLLSHPGRGMILVLDKKRLYLTYMRQGRLETAWIPISSAELAGIDGKRLLACRSANRLDSWKILVLPDNLQTELSSFGTSPVGQIEEIEILADTPEINPKEFESFENLKKWFKQEFGVNAEANADARALLSQPGRSLFEIDRHGERRKMEFVFVIERSNGEKGKVAKWRILPVRGFRLNSVGIREVDFSKMGTSQLVAEE